jgi:prepilin-type N-terminal cleavage/methylation domain-containing protein
MMTFRTHRSDNDGFSLTEVMVSASILLVLMVLLLGAAEGGSRYWNHAEKRRAVLREAGAALHLIDRDLASSIRTADPASLVTSNTPETDSLFFLVSHPEDHRPGESMGDLCATGYYVATPPGCPGERDLYRFHASGTNVSEGVREGTLSALYAGAAPGKPGNELLARHVASVRIRTASPELPDALRVSVVTVEPSLEKRLAGMSFPQRETILRREGTRLSAIVSLPPAREAVHTP